VKLTPVLRAKLTPLIKVLHTDKNPKASAGELIFYVKADDHGQQKYQYE
jgi:hypothetical protein